MGKTSCDFEYELGDKVRIWTVFQRPVGTIQNVLKEKGQPTKYRVWYAYHDGSWFTETFEKQDLTLVERQYNWDRCTCGSNSSLHLIGCEKNRKRGSWV